MARSAKAQARGEVKASTAGSASLEELGAEVALPVVLRRARARCQRPERAGVAVFAAGFLQPAADRSS